MACPHERRDLRTFMTDFLGRIADRCMRGGGYQQTIQRLNCRVNLPVLLAKVLTISETAPAPAGPSFGFFPGSHFRQWQLRSLSKLEADLTPYRQPISDLLSTVAGSEQNQDQRSLRDEIFAAQCEGKRFNLDVYSGADLSNPRTESSMCLGPILGG